MCLFQKYLQELQANSLLFTPDKISKPKLCSHYSNGMNVYSRLVTFFQRNSGHWPRGDFNVLLYK